MSIYDKSSLVLIPSGTKTSKVYSQVPTNGDGDFDFTRSTAATRVNADGNIEKETSNLLVRSNDFDNWNSSVSVSFTSGQSGYNGTNDAWKIDLTAAAGRVQNSNSTSGVHTFSLYAKAGTLNWVRMITNSASTQDMFFDLANGVLGTSTYGGQIDATITSVGSGWYRCTLTDDKELYNIRIYPAQGNGDITATSGSVYIQDAQLNQGLIAQEVITTTTTALYGGITDNVPRLDYTDSSCPALLLEPQRTNLLTQSEYFGDSYWAKSNLSLVQNAIISPDGALNAAKLVENTANSIHYILPPNNTTSGSVTESIYAKYISRYLRLTIHDSTNPNKWYCVIYDLQNGTIYDEVAKTVTVFDSKIEAASNGFYRCTITADLGASSSTAFFVQLSDGTPIYLGDDRGRGVYQGDGTSGIYIWGAQSESGSYPTSYIPTYGAGSVTRNADSCNGAGTAATFNGSEGVLYAEIGVLDNDGTNRHIGISDDTNANRLQIFFNTYPTTQIRTLNLVNNVKYFDMQSNVTLVNGYVKVAVKYKENDFALWINGVEAATDNSGLVWGNNILDTLKFADGNNASPFYGKTKQILVFPTALSDSELATLTTI